MRIAKLIQFNLLDCTKKNLEGYREMGGGEMMMRGCVRPRYLVASANQTI